MHGSLLSCELISRDSSNFHWMRCKNYIARNANPWTVLTTFWQMYTSLYEVAKNRMSAFHMVI